MKYLVTYLYIAPEGTFNPETDKQPVQASSGVFYSLFEVAEFVYDLFDGQETFRSHFVPEMEETLKTSDEYYADDYSAGQWFKVIRLSENLTTLSIGDNNGK